MRTVIKLFIDEPRDSIFALLSDGDVYPFTYSMHDETPEEFAEALNGTLSTALGDFLVPTTPDQNVTGELMYEAEGKVQ